MTAAPALALFPLEALRPTATPATARTAAPRCTWHPAGQFPPAAHRLILAPNLLDPRWWQDPQRPPTRLYTVGTAVCTTCINRGARGLWGDEMAQHFIPITEEPTP